MSSISDKIDEIDAKIKRIWNMETREAAEKLGMDSNITTKTIMRNMSKYFDIPLSTQIEYNLKGWKGYDGINIPRNHNDESTIDLQKVLLEMDTLDFKIGPLSAPYYRVQLEILDGIQKLTDIKLWYK